MSEIYFVIMMKSKLQSLFVHIYSIILQKIANRTKKKIKKKELTFDHKNFSQLCSV